ncbi:splicing factor 1-like [Paramacrobiotus metropolitanus]|uniref:splicing factor 1-like n=1 Tax=Paramacrobiotus metropolitanus TaxID=2943436 RepID=UPI00244634AA|nr:splicing factor 1-like [Paramacrobiotus metropolitanus]
MASGANTAPLGRLANASAPVATGGSLLKPDYLSTSSPVAGAGVVHGPVRPTSRFSSAPPPPPPPAPVVPDEQEKKRSSTYEDDHKERDRSSRDRDRDRERDRERDKEREKERERDRERDRDRERERERRERERRFWRGEKSRDSVSSRDYPDDYDRDSRDSGYDREDETYSHVKSAVSALAQSTAIKSNSGSREGSQEAQKPRKRSRWAEATEQRAFIPGMPTIIPTNMTKEQERAYLLQLQIEDISRKLRSGDLGISSIPEERSPSPEPIYNHEGKRMNTRDMRTRRRLEDDRHKLIVEMFDLNQDYKPPPDYKAPAAKFTDKVLIPQEEHPEINFVGLLIGPRGNTLKSLEKETGTKIIIRGKGSVKEGKIGRPNRDPLPGEDEPLHAYITGQTPEYVRGAVEKIKTILLEGIEVPEHQNDLRKQQLRELALLNGTLRDDMAPRCSNCGSTAHRTWNCPDKPNITHSVICTRCGGAGHIAKDCKAEITPGDTSTANMDDEYLSLMAELGQGPAPPKSKPAPAPAHAPTPSNTSFSAVPPPPPPPSAPAAASFAPPASYGPPPAPPAPVMHSWTPPAAPPVQHHAPSYGMYNPYGMGPSPAVGGWNMAPPPPPPPPGMGMPTMASSLPPPPPPPPQMPSYAQQQTWMMPPPPPPPPS